MPNQYTKPQLQVKIENPQDMAKLKDKFTKAYFKQVKNYLPKNKNLIDELIDKIMKEFPD